MINYRHPLKHTAVGHSANGFTRYFNKSVGYAADNLLNTLTIGDPPNEVSYTYLYDANGNLIQENTDRYFEWNYGDKLAFFKRQAGTGTPSVWVHYLYDNEGNRIKKFVNKAGNIREVTIYIDGIYEYTYQIIGTTVQANHDFNTLHIMDGSSRIATVRVGNHTADSTPSQKYFVEDHLGNASVVVKTNGDKVNLEEYYPFGESSFGSFQHKRYRYNGKEKDEHTGLYNYGQRYYAPWLCRFVSVDPIAEDYPQYTSYNYAGNKPISKRDLEGLQEEGAETGPTSQSNSASGGTQSPQSFDGIQFFQTAQADNLLPDGFTKSGTSFNAGPYTMVPQYKKVNGKDVPSYYIAGDRETGLPEYAVGIGDSGHFMKLAEEYDLKHSLTAQGGDLGFQYSQAMEQALAGDYAAAWNTYKETLKEDWGRSLSDPEYVVTTLLSLAHAGVALRSPKPSMNSKPQPARGAVRAAQYSDSWPQASLMDAIDTFAPGSIGTTTETGKTLFRNFDTGIQVVYDDAGKYFRIENLTLSGKRKFLDLKGNVPNNSIIDGRTIGRNQSEYNQVTHFRNTD